MSSQLDVLLFRTQIRANPRLTQSTPPPPPTPTLGQVKFPKFLNTPPQNLQMVDLVWASAKKFDFNPSNQPRIGLQHFMWLNLQYKTKKLTRPNFKIPFDYNLLFLVVVHENIVCPTTFIAKTWKFMGTSVY